MNKKTKTKKIFITKYALTSGILEVNAEVINISTRDGKTEESLKWKRSENHWPDYAHANDYTLTHDEALVAFEEKKAKKIESLKKQLAKLEKSTPKFVKI